MSRSTKIGLWLIPWFPALVLSVLALGLFHPWYEAYAKMGINRDGTTWIIHGPPLPLPLTYHFGLVRIMVLLSLAACAVGCAFLLLAFVRKLFVKQPL
jgi:hypothetical protein